MAGHSSTYLDQKLLDHSTGVAAWTPPATIYIALTTVILTRTDTTIPSGIEMVGLGYARAAVANNTTFWTSATIDPATSKMTVTSKTDVIMGTPTATSDWPSLPGWVVGDAPIGGNVLWSGSFTDQVGLVSSGQTPIIAAGALQLVAAGVT
jgi:hypothetical protein